MSQDMTEDLQPTEFSTYYGGYARVWYDIKTRDGTVHSNCWPNGGSFFANQGDTVIKGEDVAEFRKAKDKLFQL